MDIESLLSALFAATYSNEGGSGIHYNFPIIASSHREKIESVVREWYNDQLEERDARVGALEAKVYVYEQIIAKSNFAPFLQEKTEVQDEQINEE